MLPFRLAYQFVLAIIDTFHAAYIAVVYIVKGL